MRLSPNVAGAGTLVIRVAAQLTWVLGSVDTWTHFLYLAAVAFIARAHAVVSGVKLNGAHILRPLDFARVR